MIFGNKAYLKEDCNHSNDMEIYNHTHLFYEGFYAYVAREDTLFKKTTIRSTDLKGEMLWLMKRKI